MLDIDCFFLEAFGLSLEIMCIKLMGKKAFVYIEIKSFFVLNYFLPRNASKTTEWNPCYLKASLGMLSHVWTHPTIISYLTCYLSLLDICHVKNQRHFQRNVLFPDIFMVRESRNLIGQEHCSL